MYFLRQIILDTNTIPENIPGLPEEIVFSKNPEQSPVTGEGGVLWITDQGQRARNCSVRASRCWHGSMRTTEIRIFPV